MRGGISGGTLSTAMTVLEDVPEEKRRESKVDFALSPGMFIVILPPTSGKANYSLYHKQLWVVKFRLSDYSINSPYPGSNRR